MADPPVSHDFGYVHTDIPAGVTIGEWRAHRATERGAGRAARRNRRSPRRAAVTIVHTWLQARRPRTAPNGAEGPRVKSRTLAGALAVVVATVTVSVIERHAASASRGRARLPGSAARRARARTARRDCGGAQHPRAGRSRPAADRVLHQRSALRSRSRRRRSRSGRRPPRATRRPRPARRGARRTSRRARTPPLICEHHVDPPHNRSSAARLSCRARSRDASTQRLAPHRSRASRRLAAADRRAPARRKPIAAG